MKEREGEVAWRAFSARLHREGIKRDRVQMVGLYYPIVDEGLAGGDLEITVVLTGGCGSQYPKSKTIAVQAGTAIVFDNHTVYHRMTALRTASAPSGQRGPKACCCLLRARGGARHGPHLCELCRQGPSAGSPNPQQAAQAHTAARFRTVAGSVPFSCG